MSRYFQFTIIILHAVLSISVAFLVIEVFGAIHTHHPYGLFFAMITGWLSICFSVAWFLTDILLLFREVRKPIREEEQKLRHCLRLVRDNAGIHMGNAGSHRQKTRILLEKEGEHAKCKLLIEEDKGLNAAAMGHHTIIISRGMLEMLPDEELAAVMAHELGHLATKDCIARIAHLNVSFLPRKICLVFTIGLQCLSRIIRAGMGLGFIALVILGFLLFHFHILTYVVGAIVFILLTKGLQSLLALLWLFNSRHTEYRQDAFVHQLGLGRELCRVLRKMADAAPQKVNFFYTIRSTHPILYDRIRRLEQMEEQAMAA